MTQRRLNPIRILIVDDDRATRLKWFYSLSSSFLSHDPDSKEKQANPGAGQYACAAALEIELAEDAESALTIVKKNLEEGLFFSVAFIDIFMPPGKDGVWTASQIRALDNNVQIVMITSGDDPPPIEIARHVLPAHRLFYFRKPLYREEICQLVLALSDKWRTELLLQEARVAMEDRLENDASKLKQEIAERQRAEQASRISEAFLEAVNDGLFVLDAYTGEIKETNSSVTSLYGYTREEARQLSMGEISAGFAPYAPEDALRRLTLIREQGSLLVEWLARHKDGHLFWVEINSKTFDLDGELVILSYVRDIQVRKEAQQELLRIREALDDCGSAVIIMDQAQRPSYFNAAFGLLFGYTSDRAALVEVPALFSSAEDSASIIMTVGQGAEWAGELKMVDKDKREFPASLRATPILNDDYEIVGMTFILNDISERQELEAQLLQAQNMRAIGQLAAGIAHEINTPMQFVGDNTHYLQDSFQDLLKMIGAYQDFVKNLEGDAAGFDAEKLAKIHALEEELDVDYLEEDIPKSIGETMEGIARVSAIVKAMRQFTHPGTGAKKAMDINQAVENTVTVTRNEWRYVAEVKLDLAEDLPLAPCYPGDINQVLLNLVVNAAQAIGDVVDTEKNEHGLITISTALVDNFIEVRVGDSGGGIPEEVRDRVFEPFFTTKEVGKGTGQGLAISHAVVVKKHEGALTFETILGEGTTFIVRLPIQGPDDV